MTQVQNKPPSHFSRLDIALTLLGGDFIPPDEMHRTGFCYTDDQIRQLVETIPHPAVIMSLRDLGYYLVPGPPMDLTIEDLYVEKGGLYLFQEKAREWIFWNCIVSNPRPVPPLQACSWIAVSKVLDNNRSFADFLLFRRQASGPQQSPASLLEVAYTVYVFWRVRQQQLLKEHYVRVLFEGKRDSLRIGRAEPLGLKIDPPIGFYRFGDIGTEMVYKYNL